MKPVTNANQIQEMSVKVSPQYQIISGKSSSIWPAGTVFEQGMAAYFYAVEPKVSVTPVIKVSGIINGQLNGTVATRVEVRAINDKSEIYWSHSIQSTPEEEFIIPGSGDGQEKADSYSATAVLVDVPKAYGVASRITEELMLYTGALQLFVISEIHLDGMVNQIQVYKDIVQALPIKLYQTSFFVPKLQEVETQINLASEAGNPDMNQNLLNDLKEHPVQIVITLIWGSLLVLLLSAGKMSESKAALQHRRFKEWITEGSVEVKDRLIIHIISLEGLVDLAIDLDRRVIYDEKTHLYYVLTEDIAYVHEYGRKEHEKNSPQLGKLLLDRGLISPEQLETGLYYQQKLGTRLGESLAALGFIDETTLYSMLAAQQGTDYYELNPSDFTKADWFDKMSIKEAITLLAFPLGKRSDGKTVIACGDITKEGIREALNEKFGKETHFVVSRPAKIYEALKKLESKEKKAVQSDLIPDQIVPAKRLSSAQAEEFRKAYLRGKFLTELFLKAAGIAEQVRFSQVPEKESLLPWLVSKNIIDTDIANLLKGLEKLTNAVEWKSRKDKILPGLPELLQAANYITPETVTWINREQFLQNATVYDLLLCNYLASRDTLLHASFLLTVLDGLL